MDAFSLGQAQGTSENGPEYSLHIKEGILPPVPRPNPVIPTYVYIGHGGPVETKSNTKHNRYTLRDLLIPNGSMLVTGVELGESALDSITNNLLFLIDFKEIKNRLINPLEGDNISRLTEVLRGLWPYYSLYQKPNTEKLINLYNSKIHFKRTFYTDSTLTCFAQSIRADKLELVRSGLYDITKPINRPLDGIYYTIEVNKNGFNLIHKKNTNIIDYLYEESIFPRCEDVKEIMKLIGQRNEPGKNVNDILFAPHDLDQAIKIATTSCWFRCIYSQTSTYKKNITEYYNDYILGTLPSDCKRQVQQSDFFEVLPGIYYNFACRDTDKVPVHTITRARRMSFYQSTRNVPITPHIMKALSDEQLITDTIESFLLDNSYMTLLYELNNKIQFSRNTNAFSATSIIETDEFKKLYIILRSMYDISLFTQFNLVNTTQFNNFKFILECLMKEDFTNFKDKLYYIYNLNTNSDNGIFLFNSLHYILHVVYTQHTLLNALPPIYKNIFKNNEYDPTSSYNFYNTYFPFNVKHDIKGIALKLNVTEGQLGDEGWELLNMKQIRMNHNDPTDFGALVTVLKTILELQSPETMLETIRKKIQDGDTNIENYIDIVIILEETEGKNTINTAKAYNDLGIAYNQIGEYDNSIEYFEKGLEIRLRSLDENHPDIADSYNGLGIAYRNKKEYYKAIEYHNKALEIRLRSLGENHPDTAKSYGNLGSTYNDMGEYDKTIEYDQKALTIMLATIGEDDLRTANLYFNIGVSYNSMGEYGKAIKYLTKCLKIRQSKLGKDDPNTIFIRNTIDDIVKTSGVSNNVNEEPPTDIRPAEQSRIVEWIGSLLPKWSGGRRSFRKYNKTRKNKRKQRRQTRHANKKKQ